MLALIPLLALAAQQSDPTAEILELGERGYFLLPAETLSGAQVQSMQWSADGRFLAISRARMETTAMLSALEGLSKGRAPDAPPTRNEILLWDARTRAAKVVFTAEANLQMFSTQWLAGTGQLVITTARPTEGGTPDFGVVLVDSSGSTRQIYRGTDLPAVDMSPRRPIGVMISMLENQRSLQFFGPQGVIGSPFRFPLASSSGGWSGDGSGMAWAPDGKHMIYRPGQAPVEATEARMTPPEEKPPLYSVITLRLDTPNAPKGASSGIYLAAKKPTGEESTAVVTTDGAMATLSPDLKNVAYLTRGAALIRSIAEVPAQMLKDMRSAAERSRILSEVKQMGLALMLYAADNNDNFPASGSDVRGAIDPFLKNANIGQGFVYTFAGGNLRDVKDPSNTEVGYIIGPGGRAIVYADGSARWKPN